MLIEPDPDPAYGNATFTWTDPEPERPALDVLLRLISPTSNAHDDGDLGPYLLDRGEDCVWRITVRLPSDFRSSYQFCAVRDRPLRGNHPDEDRYRDILDMGAIDESNPVGIGPS